MRITRVDTHVVGTPWRNLTYVVVHTDEGLSGVGETGMLGHTDALLGYLREAAVNHVVGSDPFATLTAASLQVGFSTPNFKVLKHFNDFADAEIKNIVKGAPQVVDGYFEISDVPGLGVESDADAAAEFPRQQAHFDLFADGWEKRTPETVR